MAKLHIDNKKSKLSISNSNAVLSLQEMSKLAKELFNEICDCMPEPIKKSLERNNGITNVKISAPHKKGKTQYEVNITIPQEYLKRNSLYKEKYPNGVDNIINLFDKGYTARKQVYGYWETTGIRVVSRQIRKPMGFMNTAIQNFNDKYGTQYNCRAILGDRYK